MRPPFRLLILWYCRYNLKIVSVYRDIEFSIPLFNFKDVNERTVCSFFVINVIYPVVCVGRSFQHVHHVSRYIILQYFPSGDNPLILVVEHYFFHDSLINNVNFQ